MNERMNEMVQTNDSQRKTLNVERMSREEGRGEQEGMRRQNERSRNEEVNRRGGELQ